MYAKLIFCSSEFLTMVAFVGVLAAGPCCIRTGGYETCHNTAGCNGF